MGNYLAINLKQKNLVKKSNKNNEKLSQGFRRLDLEKPLNINKGLNELIKGVELSKENRNSKNNSEVEIEEKVEVEEEVELGEILRDRRTRKKS